MIAINTGRKTHYICQKCYRKGTDDAVYHQINVKRKIKGEQR